MKPNTRIKLEDLTAEHCRQRHFGISSASDDQRYLWVEARPLDSDDSQGISERFDRKIQEMFMK